MQCPNPSCQSESTRPELLMSERSGIEIDYCPRCRGIWLDRGELDKLLEKATRESEPSPAPRRESHSQHDSQRPSDYDKPRYDTHSHDKHSYDKHKHGSGYRKKSLLSELFDF